MPFGSDIQSFLVLLAVLLVVFLVADLFLAGGSVTCGLAGGMAGAMGSPWGWGMLLLLALAVALVIGLPLPLPAAAGNGLPV
ncbi:MAG: hypothetical protein ACYC66_01415 [Chloroflexota bacterium]